MQLTVPLTPIEHSSNLLAQGYDPATNVLYLQFKGGKVYQYADVPGELVTDFLNAPSMGSFFHTNIRAAFASELVLTDEE